MARTRLDRLLPRGAILLAVLTFGGYAMGLVRDRIFARSFGAGTQLDAYNAAFVLPELALDVLVASGLTAPFVPIFLGQREDHGEGAAREFGQTILTLAVLVMAAASAVLFVLAPLTVSVIAPGFQSVADRDLYTGLFRVMCVTPTLFAASIALGEVLVADRRFFFYGLAPLLYNGGIVAGTVLFASSLGIYGAALGAVLGALLHLGIRLAGIARTSFPIRARLAVRTAAVREFIRLMLPKMASHPVDPLTFLYFTALATRFGPGNVSAVSFARNFQSVPVSLIGVSIAVAAFPILSAAAASGDRPTFVRVLATNLATTAALTGGAAIALFVVSRLSRSCWEAAPSTPRT
jgi:putative peptidoglycan lipid II flippase